MWGPPKYFDAIRTLFVLDHCFYLRGFLVDFIGIQLRGVREAHTHAPGASHPDQREKRGVLFEGGVSWRVVRVSGTGVGDVHCTLYCTAPTLTKLGKFYPMRPKAREMTQHGGPPGWLAGGE